MNPAALLPQGEMDVLRFLLGIVVFLLPGIALADRVLPGERARFLLAPLLSFTMLVVAAIFLDILLTVPITRTATFLLALALAAIVGRRRIQQAWRLGVRLVRNPEERARIRIPRPPWRSFVTPAGLLLVFGIVSMIHFLPHLPGEPSDTPLDAYPTFLKRAEDGIIDGQEYPYPVHVDEHIHMAYTGAVLRSASIHIDEPYTGKPYDISLFSISGLRTERGFHVALVQVHHLTDASLPFLFHVLPAAWTGYMAVLVWYALRPAPGALASAAMVGIIPTTARFMGPGFLVPVTFGAPWIFAILMVAVRGRGPERFLSLMLLITAASFQHTVLFVIAIATGLLGLSLQPGPWRDRASGALAVLIPLLWILPALWSDAVGALDANSHLPFEQKILQTPGLLLYGFTILGAAVAVQSRRETLAPHRALVGLLLLTGASLYFSLATQHSNDGTYSRVMPLFFLFVGTVAGLGVGATARFIADRWKTRPTRQAVFAGATGLVVTGLLLTTPLHAHLATPYYRIFDEASWQAASDFAATDAGPGDVFLGHPWRSPVYNALTGAYPYAVLYPGAPPVNDAEYRYYLESGGASIEWFADRNIGYVVSPQPPNEGSQRVGADVYKLAPR